MTLCKKHEVIPIVVQDSMEEKFDMKLNGRMPVLIDVEDIELGYTRTVDLRMLDLSEIKLFRYNYRKLFNKMGLDYTEVSDRIDYFKKIELLLRRRMKIRR